MKRELPPAVVWAAIGLGVVVAAAALFASTSGGGGGSVNTAVESERVEYLRNSEAERDRNAGIAPEDGSSPEGASEARARGGQG